MQKENCEYSGIREFFQTLIYLLHIYKHVLYKYLKIKRMLIVGFMSIFANFLTAQVPIEDTINIEEIRILEKHITVKGFKKTTLDAGLIQTSKTSNLGELISQNTSIQIKSYGPAGISSISMRGAGASHTQIAWNGINLNSSMTGQADLSQIPACIFDQAVFMHAGNPSGNNNGAIGGTIFLNSLQTWNEKLNIELLQEIASFNAYNSIATVTIGNRKTQSKTNIYRKSGHYTSIGSYNDDFSDVKNMGLVQSLNLKTGLNSILSFNLWGQSYTNMTKQLNDNYIKMINEALRTAAEWKYYKNAHKISFRTNFTHESMNYEDSLVGTDSQNTINSIKNAIEYNWEKNAQLNLNAGVNHELVKVNSNNYLSIKKINVLSVFYGMNYRPFEKVYSYFLLKKEFRDDRHIPLIPSFGVDYHFFQDKSLAFKLNISRNFHSPGFNDLYWNPGGNPDLKPENGYSGEAGIEYQYKNENGLNFTSEATFFYSKIDNWIQWQPVNGSIWRPQNLREVVSKGIESVVKSSYSAGKTKISLSGSYNYTITNDLSLSGEDKNRQLMYVPAHTASFNFLIDYLNFSVGFFYNFTGERSVYSENLPAFNISDFKINYLLPLKQHSINFNFSIENVFETDFEMIKGYRMPGRTFSFSVRYNFKR